jgi:four helix bundle protein
MTAIKQFEEIHAWQTARKITKQVYMLSDHGNFGRDFGFRDQIRRAAVSVMSNIAEGFESNTQALFINYLGHAKASAGEVRSQLYVASDLGYISKGEFVSLIVQIRKCSGQIYRFMKYLKEQPKSRIKNAPVTFNI